MASGRGRVLDWRRSYFLRDRLDQPLLLGGDFNYSRLLDDLNRPRGNHEFFDRIAAEGFVSLHRRFHDADEQTYFKKGRGPHQLDYLYGSAAVAERATRCEVVPYEPISHLSDHAPLVADLKA